MSFDASEALRYSADFMLALPSIVGVAPYSAYVVQIANGQVGFNDTGSMRILSETRLLVADGYRSYAALDGYLNPVIKQERGEELIVSDGQLTNTRLVLGPLVFPYTQNGFSGGTDTSLFEPEIGMNDNIQVYVQIRGASLSPTGNYFDINEVKIAHMSALTYTIVLNSNSALVI